MDTMMSKSSWKKMNSKNFSKSLFSFFFMLSFGTMLCSCTLGFSNIQSEHRKPSKIYIHAITDSSERSGQGNRLSMEIRKRFYENTNFLFTNLNSSDYILEINIEKRVNFILDIDSCKNEGQIANESVSCSEASKDGNIPKESPSKESLYLIVKARLLKTKEHEAIFQKLYSTANMKSIDYNSIGDKGNGVTLKTLQNTPDLHSLRHLEVVDKSTDEYCKELSLDLVRQVSLAIKP